MSEIILDYQVDLIQSVERPWEQSWGFLKEEEILPMNSSSSQ